MNRPLSSGMPEAYYRPSAAGVRQSGVPLQLRTTSSSSSTLPLPEGQPPQGLQYRGLMTSGIAMAPGMPGAGSLGGYRQAVSLGRSATIPGQASEESNNVKSKKPKSSKKAAKKRKKTMKRGDEQSSSTNPMDLLAEVAVSSRSSQNDPSTNPLGPPTAPENSRYKLFPSSGRPNFGGEFPVATSAAVRQVSLGAAPSSFPPPVPLVSTTSAGGSMPMMMMTMTNSGQTSSSNERVVGSYGHPVDLSAFGIATMMGRPREMAMGPTSMVASQVSLLGPAPAMSMGQMSSYLNTAPQIHELQQDLLVRRTSSELNRNMVPAGSMTGLSSSSERSATAAQAMPAPTFLNRRESGGSVIINPTEKDVVVEWGCSVPERRAKNAQFWKIVDKFRDSYQDQVRLVQEHCQQDSDFMASMDRASVGNNMKRVILKRVIDTFMETMPQSRLLARCRDGVYVTLDYEEALEMIGAALTFTDCKVDDGGDVVKGYKQGADEVKKLKGSVAKRQIATKFQKVGPKGNPRRPMTDRVRWKRLLNEFKPHKHDVLFGRGTGASSHEGNILFRKFVWGLREEYQKTPK